MPAHHRHWALTNVTAQFAGKPYLVDACSATNNYGMFYNDRNLIWGPDEFMLAIARAANATLSPFMDAYVDCALRSKLPPLVVTLNGTRFEIPASSYVFRVPGGSCILGLGRISSTPNEWIFGAPFYRTYCVAHDVRGRRMGFAKSMQGPSGKGRSRAQRSGDSSGAGGGDDENGVAAIHSAGWHSLLPAMATVAFAGLLCG